MDYAVETVEQVRPDIGALLQLHYEELCVHKDAMALAPDWPMYQALEDAHKLLAFTARDEGKLVGYAVFFVAPHIHYVETLVANNDIIFLHQDYRNKVNAWTVIRSMLRRALRIPKRSVSTGAQLIEYSEQMLKLFGVNKVVWSIKFKLDWSVLLLRRGYAKEDFTVGKIL